jgi:ammonium transporter, Amt family
VLAVVVTTALLSGIFWGVLKATLGIRVNEAEEFVGLDMSEHGMEAYPGFVKEAMTPAGAMGYEKSGFMQYK